MPRSPKEIKRPPNRPLINIDWSVVDKFLESGCSGMQIAAYLNISHETLYDRCDSDRGMCFTDYKRSKYEKGNSQLLGKQYKLAMDGDRGMLIWLGKNRLGQADKKQIDHTTNGKDITPVFLPLKDDEENK